MTDDQMQRLQAKAEECRRFLSHYDRWLASGAQLLGALENTPADVPEVSPRRPLTMMSQKDAVMHVFVERWEQGDTQPMSIQDVLDSLEAGGVSAPRTSVLSVLSRAGKAGKLERLGKGFWGKPEATGAPEEQAEDRKG